MSEVIASTVIKRPLSEQEIAELLGVSRQAVYETVDRARIKLKRAILADRELCALMREICGERRTFESMSRKTD